jgi:vesicle transport protein SEC22
MSIATGNYCFYYMSRDNLCFLTLCEESFPKRSAFLYLEEIADLILQEMIREYGNDVSTANERKPSLPGIGTYSNCRLQWRNQVDQAARPFQFIHYDPIIQRKQREYREQRPQARSQLNEDLNEIHSIMRKNIDEILNRGEKLDQVSNISNDLRSKSKDFKWGTKKLTLQARLQQYGPMVVGATLFFIILYVKIFHIGF